MVNTINPADCKPGEVYEGTADGETWTMQRFDVSDDGRRIPWQAVRPTLHHPWCVDIRWFADDAVTGLVRLVPARPVTHQDLPDDPDDRWETFKSRFKEFDGYRSEAHQHSLWTVFRSGIQYAETRMLDHLNANGGVPAERRYGDVVVGGVPAPHELATALRDRDDAMDAESAAMLRAKSAEADRDRWRRAHEIVEQERDQARESLRRLRDETDFDLFTVRDQLKQCRGEREQMTRERDEARADRDHYRDSLGATVTERDEWRARAEAAEARLADPYSQANQDAAAWDRVAVHPALRMDLLPDVEGSYADCVFERITQLAEVAEGVTEMKPAVAAEARTAPAVTREEVAGKLRQALNVFGTSDDHLLHIADNVLTLFGVEAGQAVDPVEGKARELHEVAQGDGPFIVWGALIQPERERYLRIARHVLGQEANDE